MTPEILDYLQNQQPDKAGEITISEAFNRYAKDDQVFGRLIDGKYLDCGSPEKYLEAIVEVALSDKTLGQGFRDYVQDRLTRQP